jgi:hypothetical protein
MKTRISPLLIFIVLALVVAALLFTLPLNLFPGEITYQKGLSTYTLKDHNLSLSYFIGMGLNEGDLDNVKSFKLTAWGYALAACYIMLLPGIIAYRVYISQNKK